MLAAPADFPEYPELRRDVDFWLRVYTEISTEQGFLHDEQNLAVVYDTIDIPSRLTGTARQRLIDAARDVHVARLRNLATRWRLQIAATERRLARERRGLAPASPREALATLGYDPTAMATATDSALTAEDPAKGALPETMSISDEERRIVAMFASEASPERLDEAAQRVRFQLGQADRFRAGIVRSGAWEGHIARTFASKGLPAELAALPHVESSFNAAAYSKVGAAGLWQFMRSTGRLYMRIDDELDERLDPYRATDAAAQLLAYNYRLLGSWPLAITAYNHGAAGMRRARDSMGTTNMAVIARNYKARTFGFASRNFYPSFLAVLRIDRDPQKYFPGVQLSPELVNDTVELPAWIPVSATEAAVGVDRPALRALNPAVRDPVWAGERYLPRGYRLHLPRPAQGPPWDRDRLLAALPADQLFAAQFRSRHHVVRKGESLAQIARRHGVSRATLAAMNGLSVSASLRRGATLKLPDARPPLWQNPTAATDAVVEAAAIPVSTAAEPAAGTNGDAIAESTEPVASVSLEPLDVRRYRISEDGTTRVLEGETDEQLSAWLEIGSERLQELNPERVDGSRPGQRVRLEFTNVAREEFLRRRQAWHAAQQNEYFETRRIVGSDSLEVQPGDTLAAVLARYPGLPAWLLEQYNPNVDLAELQPGTQLIVPRVEP